VATLLGHDGVVLFVARVNDAIVGMATPATFPLVSGWRGIVEDVVVRETARGRGIARKLLEAIIDESTRLRYAWPAKAGTGASPQ